MTGVRLDGPVLRQLAPIVFERMRDEPVIMLEGARAVGKSTLLRTLASEYDATVVDLDDPSIRASVANDPTYAVSGPGPVFIDEYQLVPQILQAVKAELNRDTRPGRFVLTGSATRESLPAGAQTLTGRLHVLPVRPLSQVETDGTDGLLASLVNGADARSRRASTTTREEYIARCLAGGFPLALARGLTARRRWLDDHITTSLRRDATALADLRQAAVIPALFRQLASQTAQPLNVARAASRLDVDARTATNYVHVLEQLFVVHRLPAWGRTLGSRVAATPKLHLVDSGVAARALRLNEERLAKLDPAAMSEFGHVLETFVFGEVAAQASWLDDAVALGHYRTRDGVEVDLVVERSDGGVLGIEVKAAGLVHDSDFIGLRALRDLVGAQFIGGVVFYLGGRSYDADGFSVLPLDRLWRGIDG